MAGERVATAFLIVFLLALPGGWGEIVPVAVHIVVLSALFALANNCPTGQFIKRPIRERPVPFDTIQYVAADGIARLTLNRPDRLNSFTVAMHEEGARVLADAEADPAVRVV